MTTLLLVWYASGWAGLAAWALDQGIVRAYHIIWFALAGPVGMLVGLLITLGDFLGNALDRFDRALWRKP